MKDSLEYLPERKREELRRLAETIREICDGVEMIVLYGSYARGDYIEEEDLDPDRPSGDASDYDILVVTTEKDRFENSGRAYIGARYDPKYRISEDDLRYFGQRVELLLSETEIRCKAFLEALPRASATDEGP